MEDQCPRVHTQWDLGVENLSSDDGRAVCKSWEGDVSKSGIILRDRAITSARIPTNAYR